MLAAFALAILAAMLSAPAGAAAGGSDLDWSVFAGRWDVGRNRETTELGVEARRAVGDSRLDLITGLAATADEAVWIYAGAQLGWDVGERWELRPGFGVSLFEEGDGKDLGGPIEFRSSLELAYRRNANLSIGLMVYHLSNAGFYDLNPGANSVVLTFGFR